MLPPSIVVELASKVRACKTELDNAEAVADRSRAEYHGYLELLTYAESQTEVPAPVEPEQPPAGVLVAGDAPRGPGWCNCRLPGTPGVTHSALIPCFVTESPAAPLDERPRGLGWQDPSAWFGSGTLTPHIPATTGTDVTA